jgi:SHS2 domain-containing protein
VAGPRYAPLEHTSEAGIIARGVTLATAFANAAEGMYALILDIDGVEQRQERVIELEGTSYEDLLVEFLLELVFLTETEGLVFSSFDVEELTENRLRARVRGEPFDTERHRSNNVMVKAVTRHMLEVARQDDGYRIQVLLDI